MKTFSTGLLAAVFAASAALSGHAQEVIRVQFAPNAAYNGNAPINFTGVESSAAAANAAFANNGSNTWNYCTIPPSPTVTTNPSCSNLVASTGATTGIGISFTGNLVAANNVPVNNTGSNALENDYFVIDAGPASSTAQYAITGLPPNTAVTLYLYAPNFTTSRGYTLNLNGQIVNVPSGPSGNLLTTVTTSATGTISGTWSTSGSEGDWSGLQIAIPTVAQPTAVFPHVAADTLWQTDFIVENTSNASVAFTLKFHPDSGTTMPIAGVGAVTEVTGVLAAHATAFYTTNATGDSDGWAELDSATPLTGVAVFREVNDQTAVQLTTPAAGFTMGFDSTAPPNAPTTPYVDGIAIANVDGVNQAIITCQPYDTNGNALGGTLTGPTIPPLGHVAFLLESTAPFTGLPANTRGQLVCSSTTNVAAVELRALGSQVATLPVVAP